MAAVYVVENRGTWMAFSSFDAVTLGVSHYLEERYGRHNTILSWRRVSVPLLSVPTYIGEAEVQEGDDTLMAVFIVREIQLGAVLTIGGAKRFGATQVVTPEWVESVLEGVDREEAEAISSGTGLESYADPSAGPPF